MKSNKFDRSAWVIVVLFFIAGAVSWTLFFGENSAKDTIDIHDFPVSLDGWTSRELPISEEDYAILETRNVFSREYSNSRGQKVYLTAVYSQRERKVSHPPEVCYTGTGADILENKPAHIHIDSINLEIKANKLVLELGDVKQVSFYWFKVDDMFTRSYWKQQLLIAVNNLFMRFPSNALIRVSATISEEGEEKAVEDISDFAQVLVPNIYKYLP